MNVIKRRNLQCIVLCPLIVAATSGPWPPPEAQILASKRKWQGDSKIIGGEFAPDGRYPYTVSLIDVFEEVGCGGSLIAPDIVLTAGHCAGLLDHIEIGRYNRSDPDDDYETFGIVQELVHPAFSLYDTFAIYDKMLILLDGESSVEPIRINRNSSVPADNSAVTVMGWGVIDPSAYEATPVLMEASVNVVNHTDCSQAYEAVQGVLITSDMMCAAAPGKDTCYGDSGGPLIVKGSDTEDDLLMGVTSWGDSCADPMYPGVYSSVSYDSDWIDYVVCTSSQSPPDDFDCENVGNYIPPTRPPLPNATLPPIDTPAPEDTVNATISIQLDEFPNEIGWKIDRIGQAIEEVVQMPAGSYFNPNVLVEHKVPLHHGELYSFVIFDIFGDSFGMQYQVALEQEGNGTLPVIESEGTLGYSDTHYFMASLEAPDAGLPATYDEWQFLSLEMKFDSFPDEVGYVLIGYYSNATSAPQSIAFDTPSVVTSKSPPFYHYNLANKSVIEEIIVPSVEAEYRFFLVDLGGDGLCCDYGRGYFTLYNGPIEEGSILVGGNATGSYGFKLAFGTNSPRAEVSAGAMTSKDSPRYVAVFSTLLLLAAL